MGIFYSKCYVDSVEHYKNLGDMIPYPTYGILSVTDFRWACLSHNKEILYSYFPHACKFRMRRYKNQIVLEQNGVYLKINTSGVLETTTHIEESNLTYSRPGDGPVYVGNKNYIRYEWP